MSPRRKRNLAKLMVWTLVDSAINEGMYDDAALELHLRLITASLLESMSHATYKQAERDLAEYFEGVA